MISRPLMKIENLRGSLLITGIKGGNCSIKLF